MKQLVIFIGSFIIFILSSCDTSDSLSSDLDGGNSIGGSLASFTISENYLYTVNDGKLVSYDISDATKTISVKSAYVTNNYGSIISNIETIFPYGKHLFLGASDGMYIIDVSDPALPKYVSRYEHVESCDPVVVKDDIAYVTLREGNSCWQEVNELQVIDISDLYNPKEIISYPMEKPYGLGVSGDMLFVCDNDILKVFDCNDPLKLNVIETYQDISAVDVIPIDSVLIVLGNGELNQYDYSVGSLNLLSTIKNQ